MALTVQSVAPGSPAQRLGLAPGCRLLAVDGNELFDALDYQYYTAAPRFALTVCQNGAQQTLTVEKAEYEPFGCDFKTYLADESTAVTTTACSASSTSCRRGCANRSILRMTTSGFPFCTATISR